MLNFKFDKPVQKLMQGRGLDNIVLQGVRLKFDLPQSISSFKPELGDDQTVKTLGANKQLASIEKLLSNPLHGHPVVALNSYPTDLRAKVVAANIMESAVFEYLDKKESRNRVGLPYWARLYSDSWYGYIDKIKEHKPSLLIISNITDLSTPRRLEMLRDLLEYFDKIPRIVVQGGEDPIKFFAHRLRYPLNHAIRIGPDSRIVSPLDV
jgi:hypothetical protein